MAKVPSTTLKKHLTPSEVRATIHEIMREHNYDPFRDLIEMATKTVPHEVHGKIIDIPFLDADQKIHVAEVLAGFIAPKLKSVEVEGTIDHNFQITVKAFSVDGVTEKPAKLANKAIIEDAMSSVSKPRALVTNGDIAE